MADISTKPQLARLGRSALGVLLVGIVLLLNAMAASPKLHQRIHKDADVPGHQCAVTMFAHGQVDSASVDVPIAAPLSLIQTISPIVISFYSPAIENLPAGRAPPLLPVVS